MCHQKSAGFLLILAALAVLGGCGALDAILPTTGTYKVNALINDTTLDDFSMVTSKDKILPFFEEPVSEDPDITELVVFLKDSRGLLTGYKVTYSLKTSGSDNNEEETDSQPPAQNNTNTENRSETVTTGADTSKDTNRDTAETQEDETVAAGADTNQDDRNETAAEDTDPLELYEHTIRGNEINFPVRSLDDILPFIPLPADLPIGKYTLVFQVKGKNTILYKYEKPLFYLADAEFSFDGIQVNLPGIAENSQLIQNKNVILLDVNLDFDSRLDPYVVWYNGRRVIDEGRYSDGAGTLLWKAPEQNGFVSIRAEVFPFTERTGLTGYQKGISLLVSSKEVDMHLLSKEMPNLVQWYTFEGDLIDSLTKDSEERVIEPVGKTKLKWMPSNGTYGLVSGTDNIYKLPEISAANSEGESENADENWQLISRFKPLSDGEIYSVQFGSSDITITLSAKKSSLVLTLASDSKTYSESLKLPAGTDSFITVSVKFFIQAGSLSAKLAFVKPAFEKLSFNNQNEPVINPISVEADLEKEFQIKLGQQYKKPADDSAQTDEVQVHAFTALWDEFAIIRLPAVEIIKTKKDTKEIKDTKENKDTKDTKETQVEENAAVEAGLPETADAAEEEPQEIITPVPPSDGSNLIE